jgi:hypothetical protein
MPVVDINLLERVADSRMAEQRRKHIEYKLDNAFRKATIRTSTPHTLEIEKTNGKYGVDLGLQTSKNKTVSARSQLTALSKSSHLVDLSRYLSRFSCPIVRFRL